MLNSIELKHLRFSTMCPSSSLSYSLILLPCGDSQVIIVIIYLSLCLFSHSDAFSPSFSTYGFNCHLSSSMRTQPFSSLEVFGFPPAVTVIRVCLTLSIFHSQLSFVCALIHLDCKFKFLYLSRCGNFRHVERTDAFNVYSYSNNDYYILKFTLKNSCGTIYFFNFYKMCVCLYNVTLYIMCIHI